MICFDLDDTLYPEWMYVKSAYRAIGKACRERFGKNIPDVAKIMWDAFRHHINPFDALLQQFCPWPDRDEAICRMLHIYRFHSPDIALDQATAATLSDLSGRGHTQGIITDGRTLTQNNKIDALGLCRWIKPENIIISEQTGHDKSSAHNFKLMMQRNPAEQEFVYVADNPAKDFVHPRALGWKTVMLQDTSGTNIHPQQADIPQSHKPDIIITKLSALLHL